MTASPIKKLRSTAKRMADGWTAEKQEAFLAQLVATVNVSASARTVGMNVAGAYKLRRRDAAFRAAWAEALDEGYDRLEFALLERAINGTVKAVFKAGERVDEMTSFDDRTALQLLSQRRIRSTGADDAGRDIDAIRGRFRARIDAMVGRLDALGEVGKGAASDREA